VELPISSYRIRRSHAVIVLSFLTCDLLHSLVTNLKRWPVLVEGCKLSAIRYKQGHANTV
jgi:hypothetical protein